MPSKSGHGVAGSHLTLPRQCGSTLVPLRQDGTYGSQIAFLPRTGQRAERGQLRFSSPSALAMHDDVGHVPVPVVAQLPWQSSTLAAVQRPLPPVSGLAPARQFLCWQNVLLRRSRSSFLSCVLRIGSQTSSALGFGDGDLAHDGSLQSFQLFETPL